MGLKPIDSQAIYGDGRSYDEESGDLAVDLPFYLKQAQKFGGPILELACGTGRVSIPLAKAGFEVVGLDVSASMLKQARQKAADAGVEIEWIEGDCRSFQIDRKFGLILLPFNALAHLHDRQSHEALLAMVRQHLAAEGRFAFDFFNPGLEFLMRDGVTRYPVTEYQDPAGRGKVVITESSRYDRATQINHVKWFYKIGEAEEEVRELNMRQFFPQELDALLHYNGLVLESKYGGFDETPFESSSRHQVCVCRHAKAQ